MSYLDPEGLVPSEGAARVGAELRLVRQRLGWTLEELAAGLRIRQPYLQAIEEGRLSALPGNAYAMGFVRTYATALGLDAAEMSRRFRAEAQEVNQKTRLAFPMPVPQRGVPAGAVVLLGLVIAAGTYAAWYRYSGNDGARVVQEASAPPERLAAMLPPPAQSPQVASILPSAPPASPAQPPAAPTPAPTPALAPSLPPALIPPALVAPPPAVVAAPPPLPAAPPATSRVMLRANAGGWVQVRQAEGQVLLNRVLRTGESWPVPVRPQLLLTTSNAGGLQLLVDGAAMPSLGAPGALRRDVPLDPAMAKAGLKLAKPNSTPGAAAQ